jgi:ABC-type antimicrobial peptide transport system permease subunit
MKEVLLLAGIGIAIGLPAALGLTKLVKSQIYGVQPYDATTIILAVIGILSAAGISGYLPALRAARVDPMNALRWE